MHTRYNDRWQCVVQWLWDNGDQALYSYPTYRYVWGPRYIDELIYRDQCNMGTGALVQRLYAMQDANYNVVALAEEDGDVVERFIYDAYGRATVLDPAFTADADNASDYAWQYLYTARPLDLETGLMDYRNRSYHTGLGRFVTRDPVGYWGSGFNLYNYVLGSPILYTDGFGTTASPGNEGLGGTPSRDDYVYPGTSDERKAKCCTEAMNRRPALTLTNLVPALVGAGVEAGTEGIKGSIVGGVNGIGEVIGGITGHPTPKPILPPLPKKFERPPGSIACCDGEKTICMAGRSDLFQTELALPKDLAAAVYQCVEDHETSHWPYFSCENKPGTAECPYQDPFSNATSADKVRGAQMECRAFQAQVNCLKSIRANAALMAGCDARCQSTMKYLENSAQTQLKSWRGQCDKLFANPPKRPM